MNGVPGVDARHEVSRIFIRDLLAFQKSADDSAEMSQIYSFIDMLTLFFIMVTLISPSQLQASPSSKLRTNLIGIYICFQIICFAKNGRQGSV